MEELRQQIEQLRLDIEQLKRVSSINIPTAAVKPRHLVAGDNLAEGTLYYSDGTNFTELAPGSNGSLLYTASGVPDYLAPGSDNQILKMNGTTPNWEVETTDYLKLVDSAQTYKVQFGTSSATFSTQATKAVGVTFATAFGTALSAVVANVKSSNSTAVSLLNLQTYSHTTSGFSYELYHIPGTNISDTIGITWIAIGY